MFCESMYIRMFNTCVNLDVIQRCERRFSPVLYPIKTMQLFIFNLSAYFEWTISGLNKVCSTDPYVNYQEIIRQSEQH